MTDLLFVSVGNLLHINYLQQWAGDVLEHILYVDSYDELSQFSGKIIIIDTIEANFRFDLTRQLLEQKNYVVFYNVFESNNYFQFMDLHRDLLNKFTNYAVVGNSDDSYGGLYVNLNEFYFATATDLNKLRVMSTTDGIFSNSDKPFKFLFLNGAGRNHRVVLWKKLEDNGTLAQSLSSWLSVKDSDECHIPVKLLPKEYESPYADTEINGKYKNDWPRYRQLKNELWRNHWIDGHVVPAQYINTYFTVVSETNIDSAPFLTEKIYKPILAGHPFIVASTSGYYDQLHKLGFETFSEYIDESFDQ